MSHNRGKGCVDWLDVAAHYGGDPDLVRRHNIRENKANRRCENCSYWEQETCRADYPGPNGFPPTAATDWCLHFDFDRRRLDEMTNARRDTEILLEMREVPAEVRALKRQVENLEVLWDGLRKSSEKRRWWRIWGDG